MIERPPVKGGNPHLASRPGPADPNHLSRLSRRLYRLEIGAWARVSFSEGVTFFFLLLYVFFEYVRPQSLYPSLDVLPWSQAALFATTLGFVLSGRVTRKLHFLDLPFALFTLVVVASSFAAYRPSASFEDLDEIFLVWVLVYWLVSTVVNNEKRFLVFTLAFLLWSLKMSQHATRSFLAIGGGFRDWGATGAPGWFHNSGEMAIQMCVFLPMSWYFWVGIRENLPRWKSWLLVLLPLSALIALVASTSRGGQLGGLAVILGIVLKSKERVRGLMVGAFLLALGFLILPEEQKERFTEMGEDETSVSRLTYWEDGIEITTEHPLLGIGYRNWVPYYRNHYDAVGELPHNIFIEASAELGLPGFLGLLGLIFGTFFTNARTRKNAKNLPPPSGPFFLSMADGLDLALVGFMVSGFFVTVLYYPYLWFNLAFTASLYGVSRKAAKKARGRQFHEMSSETVSREREVPALAGVRR